jgi:tetratricopeptide (TPR) repeat protein
MNFIDKKLFSASLFLSVCLGLSLTVTSFAQDQTIAELTREARELVDQNRYIDALPLLEKIILSYPDNAEMWADFGIAIVSNAVTIPDPEERKKEMVRGIKALTRAKQLGTKNVRALHFLDEFENFDGGDNFSDDNPEVEKAMREGEAFFGRGEYDKAFQSYEKAFKLDPKNYGAVLFMGDCFYAQRKYKEAEPYFAKAVEIDPDMEMAYRYWGDALLYQDKHDEALDKFLEAMIVEPFSRMSWDSLRRWAGKTGADYAPIKIAPPGGGDYGSVKFDKTLLKAEDGTDKWLVYDEKIRERLTAGGEAFNLSDETAAWKAMAEAFRRDMKTGKIQYPDRSLINLLKLEDKNLLESYILLLRPRESFGDDYDTYRKGNKTKIKQFVREFILNLKS